MTMSSDVRASRRWYVVRSKPKREEYAQQQLVRRGVETFLPRILEQLPGRSEPSVGPLFPGYLFAHIDLMAQFNAVVWAPGVHNMVAFGDVPSPVDNDVIAYLHDRCGDHGVVCALPTFDQGDVVRVVGGPLEGLQGVVQGRASGRERVRVLMELLRRRTQVTLPGEILERVAS